MIKVSLPTSPETRAKLEAAGFSPLYWEGMGFYDKAGYRFALMQDKPPEIQQLRDTDDNLPVSVVLEFAAILGAAPPGYRLIKEETADTALPSLEWAVAKAEQAAPQLKDWAKHANALSALASSLSTKEQGEGPVKEAGQNG